MSSTHKDESIKLTYKDLAGNPQETELPTRSLHREGSNTPFFGSYTKRTKFLLPSNHLSVVGTEWQRSRVQQTMRYIDNSGPESVERTASAFIPTVGVVPSCPQSLKDKAYKAANSRALSQMRGSTVNLAQAFGERQQVVGMITNTAIRLANAMRNLRHGHVKQAFYQLGVYADLNHPKNKGPLKRYHMGFESDRYRASASLFLELQYGWRPLLNDIHDAAETLAEINKDRADDLIYQTHRVKASSTLSLSQKVVVNTADEQSLLIYEHQFTSRVIRTYRIDNEYLRYSAQLGITNPALLAWELTPFSFVVDWFLPIGNYLENAQAAWGISMLNGCDSEKYTGTTYGNSRIGPRKPEIGQTVTETAWAPVKTRVYNRVPNTSSPRNFLPQLKNPVSLEHGANAVALLVSVFRERKAP